ncbi:MAG: hypothetical protein HY519_02415 [Candidatus Aenigmarchaeota archaeon]|nr:hypothetical protein [Candidatus Aenigmarchaeota archaeon]
MTHKRNPITFENIKSLWKAAMPRMATFYADQISEHQRDLTNSASARFVPETLAMFFIASVRMRKALEKLAVDKQRMRSNALLNAGMIAAEPLYILLAAHGHSDAHEQVRRLTMEAQKSGRPLVELALADAELKPFLAKLKQDQLEVLRNPEKYTGIAAQKAENVCRHWERELKLK